MKFTETPIPGAFLVHPEPRGDERGWFARVWCADEASAHGLIPTFVQCNGSFSVRRGTLRGLHYQVAPHSEVKLVRCVRGAIFDALVDLRPESPMYCRWFGTELTPDSGTMLYVPKGCAHGYLTLADSSEVLYMVSDRYNRDSERGVPWNDPAFGIKWPINEGLTLSDKDQQWPAFMRRT